MTKRQHLLRCRKGMKGKDSYKNRWKLIEFLFCIFSKHFYFSHGIIAVLTIPFYSRHTVFSKHHACFRNIHTLKLLTEVINNWTFKPQIFHLGTITYMHSRTFILQTKVIGQESPTRERTLFRIGWINSIISSRWML